MADLLTLIPTHDPQRFAHLLPSLERHGILVADVLILEPKEVARRAGVPVGQVVGLRGAVLQALREDLGFSPSSSLGSESMDVRNQNDPHRSPFGLKSGNDLRPTSATKTGNNLLGSWNAISTLDDRLDSTLGGGIPAGYLTEITGESGAGKTQFLLLLLLSVQLASPRGLARSAVYISTESKLETSRLADMLSSHSSLSGMPASEQPSLSNIHSIQALDLETQEHILRYQLPVIVRRHNVGLVVIDSITANYRAEFDSTRPGQSSSNRTAAGAMAVRSAQLIELGAMLRDLARSNNMAVVVANQVGDRFDSEHVLSQHNHGAKATQSSQTLHPPSSFRPDDPMTLDHQQRWFTGWGDTLPSSLDAEARTQATPRAQLQPHLKPQQYPQPQIPTSTSTSTLKSPSLGLVWANQIACRITLTKTKRAISRSQTANKYLASSDIDPDVDFEPLSFEWLRILKLVFAPWTPPAAAEFAITRQGLMGMPVRSSTSTVAGGDAADMVAVAVDHTDTDDVVAEGEVVSEVGVVSQIGVEGDGEREGERES